MLYIDWKHRKERRRVEKDIRLKRKNEKMKRMKRKEKEKESKRICVILYIVRQWAFGLKLFYIT